ncbi:MAG: vanillate monooxygenase [Pseudomonadota bacterium]|jgi:vanillate O-demethylase monooxygenase subunit
MAYLRNTWYVAAWDEELLRGKLLNRRLLGESIVLFRDSKGAVSALQDRCPHRFAPLRMGSLDGDVLQCRYHGLKFNGSGECVHNPHGAVPRAARVTTYPVVERHSVVWIWMGDPDKADPDSIPDFGFNDPDRSFVGKGYLAVKSGYLLEVDNIMDLSHTEFLHASTLGSSGISKGRYVTEREGDAIWSKRLTDGEIMNDELCDAMGVPRGEPVDRWINVRWHAPANMALFAGAVPSGRPHAEGRETPTIHCFTPETETTTHYWYSICFPRVLGALGEQMAREQVNYLRAPFELEDLPMLEGQQENIGDTEFWSLKPILLAGDAGGVMARRHLAKLIAEEADSTAAPATQSGSP